MLAKYRPYNELNPFRTFEDAFAPFFQALTAPSYGEGAVARPWTPAVDVVETENDLVFKADVPDIKPEDIEVNFENGTLTLKGKREFEKKEGNGHGGYHRIERSYGSFMRAFTLPETVDPDKLTADYKNGVLTVTIAKKEIAKPKAVKVNVQG
jgi:HSP20 family protein